MTEQVDVAIIGAGIVGLATGYQLLKHRPDLRLAVVEREATIAAHQSSHNSGVIHAGVYYPPGSLKAQLCREGFRELLDFADEHSIAYRQCGKLIALVSDPELARFESLCTRAFANDVPGLEIVSGGRLREIEPHVHATRGLWSPRTGVIDYKTVCAALASEIRKQGGEIYLGCRVTGITERASEVVLTAVDLRLSATQVLSCAGLWADRVAALSNSTGDSRIVPFRGDYYRLTRESSHLVRGLVYPVPDPALPFLGVHFTRRIDDEVLAGPNAVLALARTGYRRRDISLRDTIEVLGYRGFRRMALHYARTGLREIWQDVSKRAYLAQLQRYIPELTARDLLPGPSGVRAQAVTPSGSLLDDFSFGGSSRVIHVQNAPSPAATSSLAIGRLLAERALGQLELRMG